MSSRPTAVVTERAPAAIGPYSQAIRTGNLLFTSGQIPLDPDSGAIPESFEDQVRLAFTNLRAVVEAAGSSMADVVKVTCFLADMDDFPRLNEIYAEYFNEPYPARSCIQAARLPRNVRVELEAVAALL